MTKVTTPINSLGQLWLEQRVILGVFPSHIYDKLYKLNIYDKYTINMRGVETLQNCYKFPITITTHPWRDSHSANISTCKVSKGKGWDSSF